MRYGFFIEQQYNYCQTSNISHTLVGNNIVDHSDVVGALPVGTAPTTSFLNLTPQWIEQRQLQDEATIIKVLWFGVPYIWDFTVMLFVVEYVSFMSMWCVEES